LQLIAVPETIRACMGAELDRRAGRSQPSISPLAAALAKNTSGERGERNN
jgi:hypothetical protein